MAREARFTRETALEYLKSRPETHGRKPLEELKTAELTRKARTAEKAEREGRQFSSKEARGHAGSVSGRAKPITHIDPKNPPAKHPGWKYQQDQFVVGRESNPPSTQDVLRAVSRKDIQNRKEAHVPAQQFTPEPEITFYVYGLYKKSGIREPKTLSIRVNQARLAQAYAAYPGNTNDMMNDLFGYDVPVTEEQGEGWLQVYSVSVVTGQYVPVEEEE